MNRRFQGYVVGRKSVRQEHGWKIARRTRKGNKVFYFAPEQEIASGMEMHPGAEVSFSLVRRSGQAYAVDVQPKPPRMEDSMRKWYLSGVFAALVLAFVALAATFEPHRWQPVRTLIVETRAEWALRAVRKLSIDQVVTDEVVRRAIHADRGASLYGVSWAAREAIYDEHQCYVFAGFYENPEEACWVTRYTANPERDSWWYDREGIPVSIAPIMALLKDTLFALGRSYLANPDNLEELYLRKRDLIVAEVRTLPYERQQQLRTQLASAAEAFKLFRTNSEVRRHYEEALRLEQAWRESEFDDDAAFTAMEDARLRLIELVRDNDAYSFAGRRHAEGGDELVLRYIAIMEDMLSALNG